MRPRVVERNLLLELPFEMFFFVGFGKRSWLQWRGGASRGRGRGWGGRGFDDDDDDDDDEVVELEEGEDFRGLATGFVDRVAGAVYN